VEVILKKNKIIILKIVEMQEENANLLIGEKKSFLPLLWKKKKICVFPHQKLSKTIKC